MKSVRITFQLPRAVLSWSFRAGLCRSHLKSEENRLILSQTVKTSSDKLARSKTSRRNSEKSKKQLLLSLAESLPSWEARRAHTLHKLRLSRTKVTFHTTTPVTPATHQYYLLPASLSNAVNFIRFSVKFRLEKMHTASTFHSRLSKNFDTREVHVGDVTENPDDSLHPTYMKINEGMITKALNL